MDLKFTIVDTVANQYGADFIKELVGRMFLPWKDCVLLRWTPKEASWFTKCCGECKKIEVENTITCGGVPRRTTTKVPFCTKKKLESCGKECRSGNNIPLKQSYTTPITVTAPPADPKSCDECLNALYREASGLGDGGQYVDPLGYIPFGLGSRNSTLHGAVRGLP